MNLTEGTVTAKHARGNHHPLKCGECQGQGGTAGKVGPRHLDGTCEGVCQLGWSTESP